MSIAGQSAEQRPESIEVEVARLVDDLAAARLHAEHLEQALLTGRQIGMAMGILMCRRLVTENEAFELLKQRSMASNRKLRDVAEGVILTGDA